jgi:hypothetical protein
MIILQPKAAEIVSIEDCLFNEVDNRLLMTFSPVSARFDDSAES